MSFKDQLKKFWEFLKEDSWQSWLVSLILIVVIIKFIFFPIMSAITGTPLPLVVVESCSMYHESDFDSWWSQNAAWYESKNISKSDFEKFSMHSGLNKGDILLVTRAKQPKEGDIIIFNADARHPLIHRVVSLQPLQTKGDHNTAQLVPGNNQYGIDETNISSDQLVGKASFKVVPLLGWVKLIWFEPSRPASERGFCR
jgi:signal peptidase I